MLYRKILFDLKSCESSVISWLRMTYKRIIFVTWMRHFILYVPDFVSHLVSFFLFFFPTCFAESLLIRLLVDPVSTRVKYLWFPFWSINSYKSFTLLVYVVVCIMHISLVHSYVNDVLMVLIIILEFIRIFRWFYCILYWRLRW